MLDRLREKNPLPAGAMPVAAGLVVAGVANFGFLPIAYRSLSPDDYAALGVLWSLMFAVGNGVMQPVEQEVARAVSERRARGVGPGPVIKMAGTIGAVFALVLAALALLTRQWVLDPLFDGQTGLELAFLLGLFTFCVGHLTRGTLSSHGRFGAYGIFFSIDGLFRLVAAAALALAAVAMVGAYGLALALSPLIAAGIALIRQRGLLEAGPEAKWSELSRALGWLLAGTVSIALIQQGGTVAVQVLATDDEEAAAGVFLNGLVLARIPLFMFQAVLASLLPKLSHLAGAGHLDEFTTALRRLVAVILGFGAVAVVLAATIGPAVASKVFAGETGLTGRDLGLLAASVIMIIAAICLDQALIALSGHSRMAIGWMLALVVFVVVIALGDDLFLRVELGMLAASVVAFVWMWAWLAERLRHHAKGREIDLAEAAAELQM